MKLVEEKSFKVVGIKVESDWRGLHIEMPKAWQEVIKRANEIENRDSAYFFDICLQLVGDEFTQLVGCEVSDLEKIPEGMTGVEVPAATYVYYRHVQPVTEMANSFADMYEWAKTHGYTADPTDFKIQKSSFGDEEEHHLYIRVLEGK